MVLGTVRELLRERVISDHILDVGCGPGTVTIDLDARAHPPRGLRDGQYPPFAVPATVSYAVFTVRVVPVVVAPSVLFLQLSSPVSRVPRR